MLIKNTLLSAFVLLLSANNLWANEPLPYTCPEKVAYQNSTGPMVVDSVAIFKAIYQDLGCETTFLPLPGRRAIRDFREGLVSGEIFRATIVEKQYGENFVRSANPIFTYRSSIWRHPNTDFQSNRPLGYQIGIVWQETYMRDKKGTRFHSSDQIFDAYNRGTLRGFIANNYSLRAKLQKGEFSSPPVLEKEVFSAPMYHFLGKSYVKFMAAFDAYIKTHDPFKKLDQVSP